MSQPTYENISPLIIDVQTQGRTVNVVFQCPESGERVTARHHFRQQNSTTNRMSQAAQRSLMYSVQRSLSGLIRGIFGSGVLSRAAGDMARQGVYETQRQRNYSLSGKEQKQATVEAFRSVQSRFAWSSQQNRWLSAKALQATLSPFQNQLNQAPVQHRYDQKILARMLVEIAMADGVLAQEESDWLREFLHPSLGSIETISRSPKLTRQEFDTVSRGPVRQTMFMLAWTLALADEEFDQSEKDLLMRFASQLGLPSQQVQSACHAARGYIVDQVLENMFSWGGHDPYARQKLFNLAQKIGMTQEEALTAEAQFQRRRG